MIKRKKGTKVVQSKKNVYDGITFQSMLESYMYQLLKEASIQADYEGRTYVLLEQFDYPTECIERIRTAHPEMKDRRKVSQVRYTPDFVDKKETFIIETKGRANESFPLRWKMLKDLLYKKNKKVMLFKPTTKKDCEQVIKILKEKGYGKN